MSDTTNILWLDAPEDHDYPAAESFLLLIYPEGFVTNTVRKLEKADMTAFKAKDIFRASGLSLLGVSNSHVAKNLKKIKDRKKLSPILLVRDDRGGVIIADGYHRLCAVYALDEDALIPSKIV